MSVRDPRISRGDNPVVLSGPAGEIQAILTEPKMPSAMPWLVVIGHPHPQMGGTMHNKVAQTLARSARDQGGFALRFNFRGVEGSAGTFDEGRGELEDFLSVCQWGVSQFASVRCLLGGFSFGSFIASAAAALPDRLGFDPEGLLLVAPPVNRMLFAPLGDLVFPVEVIQGQTDDVVLASDVLQWFARDAVAAEHADRSLSLLHGADHFFHGQLAALKRRVEIAYRQFLKLPEAIAS